MTEKENNDILPVIKGTEYYYQDDVNIDAPECPHCHMPVLGLSEWDIGTKIQHSCGEKMLIEDTEWIRKYIKENTGERIGFSECLSCGGTVKRTEYMTNGKWRVGHGECLNCGIRFIV